MTNIVHNALPQPERSWLRKMSLKTMISSQIQINQRKNHSMDQKTCPVPNVAKYMGYTSMTGWSVWRGGNTMTLPWVGQHHPRAGETAGVSVPRGPGSCTFAAG